MDAQYIIGIPEIDAQHEEIDQVARSLVEAIGSKDQWHMVHYILVRLHELLRIHFTVEESIMRIVAFPELDSHQVVHREILGRVEGFKVLTLQIGELNFEKVSAHQIFVEHVMDHDKRFADFVRTSVRIPKPI